MKNKVLASVNTIQKVMSVWTVFDPNSMDDQEEHVSLLKEQEPQEEVEDLIRKIDWRQR